MNGWIIAFLIISGIFAYIGIAALFYLILVKCFDEDADEDTAMCAFLWVITVPFFLLFLPFMLFEKLTEWIGEHIDK